MRRAVVIPCALLPLGLLLLLAALPRLSWADGPPHGRSATVDLFAPARPPAPPPSLGTEPSLVIYPAQRLPLKFSHARHLQRGATCVGCHTLATSSVSARDSLIPGEAACQSCHAIDHQQPWKRVDGPPASCASCHVGFPQVASGATPPPGPELEALVARVEVPAPNLKFNHRLHAAAALDCSRCHGDFSQVELATRAQLPKMALCLGCHREGPGQIGSGGRRLPTARCTACHLQQGDGTLEQRFPSGRLVPSGALRGDDHGPGFAQAHRQVAVADPSYCQSCHTESWCQRCHNGVVKPFDLHGGDYVHRHGQDARRNQPDCTSCHRQQTFCLGCHERLGVASHSTLPGSPSPSAFAPASPRRFHPDGWASAFGSENRHAQEAQRNLRSCTSCHREETCLACHSGLGDSRIPGGANPHPSDWLASGRCRSLLGRNSRVCLKCHRDGSPELSCSP